MSGIFLSCHSTFLALYLRFGERFRGGKYILVSFLFAVLLLTVPPCAQPFVEVGGTGTCPPPPGPYRGVGVTGYTVHGF